MIEGGAAKGEESGADVFGKVQRLLSPRERRLNVSFEPFSAIIIDKLSRIADRRERVRLFEEIMNDSRTILLNEDSRKGARTVMYKGHKGQKTPSWEATVSMAKDINANGRNVCFLPEYKDKSSADALIQFQKQWRIADFKHSTTDNYNTIATDLQKGFKQAQCVVLKMESGNLDTFRNIIRQLERSGTRIRDIVLINKYGKVIELEVKTLLRGTYEKKLRGKM